MDNSYCCVPQCNSLGSHLPRTSFHRFPRVKDEASKRRREEWIRLLKIGKKVSNRMVVCGKHFQPSDFLPQRDGPLARTRLRENAIPSLKLPLSSCENRSALIKKREDNLLRRRRIEMRERSKQQIPKDFGDAFLNDSGESSQDTGEVTEDVTFAAGILMSMKASTKRDAATQVSDDDFFDFVSKRPVTKCDAGAQVKSGDLIIPRSFLSNLSVKQTKILTGITSALVDTLISILETKKTLKSRKMPLKDQVIMTLMKLKHGMSFALLSVLFECTSTTCKSIFKDIVRHLAESLKCAVPWLSKEAVLKRMPRCFRKYKKTRVVLDCTEISVTKSRCTKCKIMSYSHYKCDHTIKVMVGIAPSGLITFISPVFGGRASDKVIFEQSGIIEYLEPHEDAVMVDKGFHIEDICAKSFIDVIRPPFLKQKKQFSEQETTVNTNVARARVHVERMIQRIKIFKIFEGKIHWSLLSYISDIIMICSALANLGNPILGKDKF